MIRYLGIVTVFVAALARAGALTPPAGPVAPTPGPEPRIAINAVNTPGDVDSVVLLSQAGSYYPPANARGIAGRHGIKITATGGTLGLDGFSLIGGAGSLDGVRVPIAVFGVTIKNGVIRNWAGSGIDSLNGS